MNNKGVSLVDIIVGMAIFAIAVVPVLPIFVSTSQYNLKSRIHQRTAVAAENIMENFKAYDVEALCRQFAGEAGPAVHFCTLAAGGSTEVHGYDSAGKLKPVFSSGDFVGSDNDSFLFRVNGMNCENTEYDAEIEVSPVGGRDTILEIPAMNAYQDAIFRADEGWDTKANALILEDFLQDLKTMDPSTVEYTIANLDTSKISMTKRETKVDLDTSGGNTTKVTVSVVYSYAVTDYPYYDIAGNDCYCSYTRSIALPIDEPDTSIECYNNLHTTGSKLENVYIFYYPSYEVSEDKISINSNLTSGVNLYLIKQKSTSLSDTLLQIKEASYGPVVEGTFASEDMILYHNFDENISGSSSVIPASISGFSEAKSYMEALTCEKQLLYSVKVSIFEAGQTQALVVLEGTMND